MKFSEVVAKVIDLAGPIRAYWDAELPKAYPKYPLVYPGEVDPPPPPEVEVLRQFLLTRPAEDVFKLRPLASVGSGMPPVLFEERWRRQVKERINPRGELEALARHPPSPIDLRDGLAALAAANIDVDAAQPAVA